MDLVLYRTVGALNRVALGPLATAEYYHAERDEKGVITLLPVNIVGAVTAPKRLPGEEPIPGTDSADAPWQQEESVVDPDGTN